MIGEDINTNTVVCIIAIGIVVLLIILVRVFGLVMVKREKDATQVRIEKGRAWTEEYQDQRKKTAEEEES